MMTKLSVNINKIATIRNARGGSTPNLITAAKKIQTYGADGITIHPRPDERHITLKDVYDLNPEVHTEYNIEGYPNDRFLKIITEIKPAQATLVPDPPGVLTSNEGWDTVKHFDFLNSINTKLQKLGVRTSLFIGTDLNLISAAAEIGVDRIEFYTGPYADHYEVNKADAISSFIAAAKHANSLNLGINAGHDLNLANLKYFKNQIPQLLEVSIGHALVSDALYLGLENTVAMYKSLLTE